MPIYLRTSISMKPSNIGDFEILLNSWNDSLLQAIFVNQQQIIICNVHHQ